MVVAKVKVKVKVEVKVKVKRNGRTAHRAVSPR